MKTTKINFITIKLTLLVILTSVFLTVAAQAATYTVNSAADPGDGVCNATECTLREAIAAANGTTDNDTIGFNTTFNVARTITLNGTQLAVANNGTLTISGPGANLLTISGNNASRIFSIGNTANATISGLTITGGNGAGDPNSGLGGGIYNNQGTLSLNSSSVSNNSAFNGGGIYNNQGTLTLNNSTVSNNRATGEFSGGIDNFNGTLVLSNSTVSGNSAVSFGGGIVNNTTTATLSNSTVSNNSANNGGGIFNFNGGTLTLANTIIANSNSGGDCVRIDGTVNASYSLIAQNLTCVNGTNSNNNRTGDPNLGTLANNGGPTFTHALLAGSIAIDTGNSTLTTDQRGFTRPVDNPSSTNGAGNLADIGSFEVQITTAASVSIGGRVLVGKGRGLMNAIVYLTDSNGNVGTARTNPFGYYRFYDLTAGQTVIITIASKRYQFAPQVVSVTEDIEDLNFFAGLLN